jgi:hypothetical protein
MITLVRPQGLFNFRAGISPDSRAADSRQNEENAGYPQDDSCPPSHSRIPILCSPEKYSI